MIPVVDIFAGAGGLGEGFAKFQDPIRDKRVFRVALSAEMDANAVKTLRTRAFFHQFDGRKVPDSYYEYLAGRVDVPWTEKTRREWEQAGCEALQLELGDKQHDRILHSAIGEIARKHKKWVLIGGPPCQAYSVIGRARNKGVSGYVAENDNRHFLYEHYLKILADHKPNAFVLENVEGMLTSTINGRTLFEEIKGRLEKPGRGQQASYKIVPLIRTDKAPTPRDFLVEAERLGLPQKRHRVILVGILEHKYKRPQPWLNVDRGTFTVEQMIGDLPPLRSRPTDFDVSDWSVSARDLLQETAGHAADLAPDVCMLLSDLAGRSGELMGLDTGDRFDTRQRKRRRIPKHLVSLIVDKDLKGFINHETRGHMRADLMRYAYAAAFTQVRGRSPRGAGEFPEALHPKHKNWKDSKKFVDRFKVQRFDAPSSTIVSHLAKDGHYFIHPDPMQIRSLTVREAARLQTFPDNYKFEGPAGSQRRQVGNAVPPWLGYKIAEVVHHMIK